MELNRVIEEPDIKVIKESNLIDLNLDRDSETEKRWVNDRRKQ